MGYADICLLVPSRTAINSMLQICEDVGLEFRVEFNSSESHVTICTTSDTPLVYAPLVMNRSTVLYRNGVVPRKRLTSAR